MAATKLFLGGVSYNSTEDSIRTAFAEAGEVVSVKIIYRRDNGLPRGIAFVEMSSEEEAKAAIEMWDGKELDGRRIVVNEARPDERQGGREGGFGGDRPRSGGFGGGDRHQSGGFGGGRRDSGY